MCRSHSSAASRHDLLYDLSQDDGYERLYRRLTRQPNVEKPKLGKRKSLEKKPVKTNPAMYITSPIDLELWKQAKWNGTFYVAFPDRPPVLGLAFRNEEAARKIFAGWHERYGGNDEFEEIRISIIEGSIQGEDEGYTVHICSDPEAAIERYKAAGYEFDGDILMAISRMNRMAPPADSQNLSMFKDFFRRYKTYYLAPGVLSRDGKQLNPIFELGIYKSKISFRQSKDIGQHDIDSVVLATGEVKRDRVKWD